jgi:hypothetical protein
MEVLQRTANLGSIATGAAYEIDNSLKIEDDNAEHMTRTYSEAGVKTKGTISFWHKRTEIQSGVKRPVDCADGSSSNSSGIFIDGHRLCFDFGGNGRHSLRANALMRDTSAWYHLMATWDTSQGTDSNRTKIYINGEQVTDLHEATYPSQNAEVQFFTNTGGGSQANKLFCQATNTSNHPNGYFAEFHYVNNSQLSPTDFGEYDSNSGIWKPKEYTGTYGDTGFYLDFADASDLGDDESGNGNDFTEVNITAADQATDTPTNNFCTLNANFTDNYVDAIALEGGTYMKRDGGNNYASYIGTMGVTAGKWYWEFYIPSRSGTYGLLDYIGLHTIQGNGSNAAFSGIASSAFWLLHYGDYSAFTNGSLTSQNTEAGLPSVGTGGVGHTYGVAFNADEGEITFYDNGSLVGNAGIDIYDLHDDMGNGIFVLPFFQVYDNNLNCNFGGYSSVAISSAASDANGYGTFEYAPPTGYYALCTKNLAEFG